MNHGPFTVADFTEFAALSIGAWSAVPEADWASPAATLEWSRFETADYTIDCVFSYAFFLASRAQDTYPPFGEVHALDGATPRDLVDALRAMTNLLTAAVTAAPPETQSIIWRRPEPTTGFPNDFAARVPTSWRCTPTTSAPAPTLRSIRGVISASASSITPSTGRTARSNGPTTRGRTCSPARVVPASAVESLGRTVVPRFATQSWHEIPPFR